MAVSGSNSKTSHCPSSGGEGAFLFGDAMGGMIPASTDGFGGDGGSCSIVCEDDGEQAPVAEVAGSMS